MMQGAASPNEVSLLQERFRGTSDEVRGQLKALETAARDRNIGPDTYGDVLIVLGEVLNNIVEHAFHDIGEGWIDCSVKRLDDRISIETCDNGTPLPPSVLGTGQLPEFSEETDSLPEGGFGWFIVHALASDMIYERDRGTNRLSFSLELA